MTAADGPSKILFVTRSLHVGGMEQMVIELANSIRKQGNEVKLCTIEDPGQLAQNLPTQIELIALNKPPGLRLEYAFRLRRILSAWRPDIIHSHNETGHFYAALANLGNAARTKLVHSKHGRGDLSNKKSILRNRLASRLSDIVVAVSEDVANVCKHVEKVPSENVRTVINGIDLGDYVSIARKRNPDDPIIFGHVGRLDKVKNQRLMIKALHTIRAQLPNSKLHIAGDGPLRASLEELVRDLGLIDSVKFLGYQSDIAATLTQIDIFLLSSVSEGTPLVIIEAMASGCPIVATNVGGLSEMIDDRRSGLLVPTEDVASLAQRMLELATDQAMRIRIGERAREVAKARYGIERMTREYCDIYHSLLK